VEQLPVALDGVLGDIAAGGQALGRLFEQEGALALDVFDGGLKETFAGREVIENWAATLAPRVMPAASATAALVVAA